MFAPLLFLAVIGKYRQSGQSQLTMIKHRDAEKLSKGLAGGQGEIRCMNMKDNETDKLAEEHWQNTQKVTEMMHG